VTIARSINSIPQRFNIFVNQIMRKFLLQEPYVAEKCKNIIAINIFLFGGPKYLSFGEQQYVVWDTPSQRTK